MVVITYTSLMFVIRNQMTICDFRYPDQRTAKMQIKTSLTLELVIHIHHANNFGCAGLFNILNSTSILFLIGSFI